MTSTYPTAKERSRTRKGFAAGAAAFGAATLLTSVCAFAAPRDLETLPDREPQTVFAGKARRISTAWRNASQRAIQCEVRPRLFQGASTVAAQWGDGTAKNLHLLPAQTVLETAEFDFPQVRAQTRFLIQWIGETNQVLGITEVEVYPTNLLQGLSDMAGEPGSLGVLDSDNQLKPLLRELNVSFVDLDETGLDRFNGKLAIIESSLTGTTARLEKQILRAAVRGIAVVSIRPPPEGGVLEPSFQEVRQGSVSLVIAQPALVANLSSTPISQANLVQLCRRALSPGPARFADP